MAWYLSRFLVKPTEAASTVYGYRRAGRDREKKRGRGVTMGGGVGGGGIERR
jgi:hypothetical protein